MSVATFLSQLRRLEVQVWVEGESLRCNAPAGALTDELREELRQRKRDIVSFLRMADAVVEQQPAIVPLQPRGTKVPVFGVPGAGDVFCFRALAEALGTDQPFFGLQPPGSDGRSASLARVEDMAAYFAAQIRTFRPEGPWIISGKCIGGTVAYELARQLAAEGGRVAFLAFFGVPYPTFFGRLNLFRHRMEYRAGRLRRRAALLAGQSARERLEYAAWRLRLLKGGLEREPDPVLEFRAKAENAMLGAVRRYEPRPSPVRVQHFVPCESWARRSHVNARRWQAVAEVLALYSGPEGCTEDDMLLDAYAPLFAEHFRQSRRRVGL